MNQENSLRATYHPTYHEVKVHGSFKAARAILPLVFERFQIRSVLDVGCGPGSWLAVAQELGANFLLGLEGEWALEWKRQQELPLCRFELVTQDLEERFDMGKKFDLVVCLEVAEHLSEERGPSLVSDLCAAAPRVLFSAAIPKQGGIRHLNERWQSYWAKLFQDRGYLALNFIRETLWSDKSIPEWYVQNTILYVQEMALAEEPTNPDLTPTTDLEILNVVHPRVFARKVTALSLRKRLMGLLWDQPIQHLRRIRSWIRLKRGGKPRL